MRNFLIRRHKNTINENDEHNAQAKKSEKLLIQDSNLVVLNSTAMRTSQMTSL